MATTLTCAICLDIVKDATICRFCKNFFCKTEILAWVDTHETCPMCRHADMDPAIDLLHLSWMSDITTDFLKSKKELKKSKNNLKRINRELSQKRTELVNQQNELAELQEQHSNQTNELVNQQNQLAELQEHHANQTTELVNTSSALSQRTTESTNQQTQIAELQEQLSAQNNHQLRRELQKTKRHLMSMTITKNDEMDKNGQLFNTNQRLEKRLHTLEKALTTIKGAFETTNPRKRRRTETESESESDPQE